MISKQFVFLIVYLLFFKSCIAQDSISNKKTFLYLEFIRNVKQYHPLIVQSRTYAEQGRAYIQKQRGQFDPQYFLNTENKKYDGKKYYDIQQQGIKIPIYTGIELGITNTTATGTFLNPEDILPAGGQTAIGISIPMLKNLIMDERRNAIKNAKLYKRELEFKQIDLTNEILEDASSAYFNWYIQNRKTQIFEAALVNAKERLNQVVAEVAAGARGAIDSLEIALQLNKMELLYRTNKVQTEISRLYVSMYLWNEDFIPLEIDSSVVPSMIGLEILDSVISLFPDTMVLRNINLLNPNIAVLPVKKQMLENNILLAKSNLLPKFNIKYNSLEYNNNLSFSTTNNYQFGINAGISLFMRKERADYKLAKISAKQFDFMAMQKTQTQMQKIKSTWLKIAVYAQNEIQMKQISNGSEVLLRAEMRKFEIGESNAFLVNSRELKWIENQIELADYIQKNLESKLQYLYHSGVIGTVF